MFHQYITNRDYWGLTKLRHTVSDSRENYNQLLMKQLGEDEIDELIRCKEYDERVLKEIEKAQGEILRLTKGFNF